MPWSGAAEAQRQLTSTSACVPPPGALSDIGGIDWRTSTVAPRGDRRADAVESKFRAYNAVPPGTNMSGLDYLVMAGGDWNRLRATGRWNVAGSWSRPLEQYKTYDDTANEYLINQFKQAGSLFDQYLPLPYGGY